MRKVLLIVAAVALSYVPAVHAVFINFETVPGLTGTPNPAQGGLLNNNSELNDEIVPFRITSGGLSSTVGDTAIGISGLLDLTGSPLGPARSGTNVVAGLEGGSGGPGSQALIDFRNFVEVRVLDADYVFVSIWIQLFGAGVTANVNVCSDLNCGDQLTSQTGITTGLFSFTAPAGEEIRNISMFPIVPAGVAGGMWVDDLTLNQAATPPPGGSAPEPASILLLALSLLVLGNFRRARQRAR